MSTSENRQVAHIFDQFGKTTNHGARSEFITGGCCRRAPRLRVFQV